MLSRNIERRVAFNLFGIHRVSTRYHLQMFSLSFASLHSEFKITPHEHAFHHHHSSFLSFLELTTCIPPILAMRSSQRSYVTSKFTKPPIHYLNPFFKKGLPLHLCRTLTYISKHFFIGVVGICRTITCISKHFFIGIVGDLLGT